MFTVAHITDPHLAPLPPAPLGALCSKRLLGYLSWTRRRRHIHQKDVLAALVRDLASLSVDQVTVTGDLTNISLPDEFSAAASWLAGLGPPERVTVVPGNHDRYVPLSWEETWAKWRLYMAGDGTDGPQPPEDFDDFPFVRRRGPVALIGASTACPTLPGFATGTLGANQLTRIDDTLRSLRQSDFYRILLLHHPPKGKVKWRKRLTDAKALEHILAEHGVELVLHGHDHSFSEETLAGPDGPIQVLGIPSASAAVASNRHPNAHYAVIAIGQEEGSRWRVEISHRGYEPRQGTFREVRKRRLEFSRRQPEDAITGTGR